MCGLTQVDRAVFTSQHAAGAWIEAAGGRRLVEAGPGDPGGRSDPLAGGLDIHAVASELPLVTLGIVGLLVAVRPAPLFALLGRR